MGMRLALVALFAAGCTFQPTSPSQALRGDWASTREPEPGFVWVRWPDRFRVTATEIMVERDGPKGPVDELLGHRMWETVMTYEARDVSETRAMVILRLLEDPDPTPEFPVDIHGDTMTVHLEGFEDMPTLELRRN